jgi:hypothetical protein
MPGHLCWVMPGLVGASYGRVAAEEAAMAPAESRSRQQNRTCRCPRHVRLFTPVVAVLRAVVWIGLAECAGTAVG